MGRQISPYFDEFTGEVVQPISCDCKEPLSVAGLEALALRRQKLLDYFGQFTAIETLPPPNIVLE